MATKKTLDDAPLSMDSLLGASTPAAPDCIEATYEGQYFKGMSGGTELAHYKTTCKIPVSWLERDDLNPMGFFRKLLANRPTVLGALPGYSGVHTCMLVATSPLPDHLTEDAFLRWCSSFEDLADFAKRRKMPVKFELYADANELRSAISRWRSEPDAFVKEQEKKAGSKETHYRSMEADLQALGY